MTGSAFYFEVCNRMHLHPQSQLSLYGSSEGLIRAASPLLLTMGDVLCEELEDLVHFSVRDLPSRGYVVMEEIRRQGKLCDVTLKVLLTYVRSRVAC